MFLLILNSIISILKKIQMKHYISFLWVILLISCNQNLSNQTQYQQLEDKLTPKIIVEKNLTNKQVEHIKNIHRTFSEVYPISFEEMHDNFLKDQNPDKEIEVWLAMVESYQKFSVKNKGEHNIEKRREAFGLIMTRSMMSENEVLKDYEIKLLNKKEVDEIFKTYKLDKHPVKIETH